MTSIALSFGIVALGVVFAALRHRWPKTGALYTVFSDGTLYWIALVSITGGFAVSLKFQMGALLRHWSDGQMQFQFVGLLVAWIVLVSAGAYFFGRLPPRLRQSWLLVLFSVVFFVAHGIYLYLVDPVFVSDFKKMWDFAMARASAGSWITPTSAPHQRTLVYQYPIAVLFGTPTALKITNVLSVYIAAMLSYLLAREWFGVKCGMFALLLMLLVPETYFASAIPSHDLFACLYLMISLSLINLLVRRSAFGQIPWALVISIGLGLSIQLLDHLRTMRVFLVAALVVYFVFVAVPKGKNTVTWQVRARFSDLWNANRLVVLLVMVLLIPAGVSFGVGRFLEHQGITMPRTAKTVMGAKFTVSNSSAYHNGLWGFGARDRSRYLHSTNLSEIAEFGVDRFLSEAYYGPLDRFEYIPLKLRKMFNLGSESAYYYDKLQKISIVRKTKVLDLVNRVHLLVFSLLGLITVPLLIFRNVSIPDRAWVPLLFMSSLVIALLLFAESQARHLLPFAFLMPIFMSAALLAPRGSSDPSDHSSGEVQ